MTDTTPAQGVEAVFEAMALGDPAFGCGAVLEQRFHAAPLRIPCGDPVARAAFVRTERARADEAARALVRALVPPALAVEVAEFVASQAGQTLWAAEMLALTYLMVPNDEFFVRAAEYYSQPAFVGLECQRLIADVAAGRSSPSPMLFPIVGGAQRLADREAEAVRCFYATDAGQRWLAARTQAFATSDAGFREFRTRARDAGFLREAWDAMPELLLRFDAPAAKQEPALVFAIDGAGNVQFEGRDLPDVGRKEELRTALRVLRDEALAAGIVTLEDEAGYQFVPEPVVIHAAQGTPWAQIDALMKLISEPGIAFWKVELATEAGDEPGSTSDRVE